MNKQLKIYSTIFVLIGISTISSWSNTHIPILNDGTTMSWILWISMLVINFQLAKRTPIRLNRFDQHLLYTYFIWLSICILRGIIFEADTNYWIWKQLISSSLFLFIPSFLYTFSIPIVCQKCMKSWLQYGAILFCIWLILLNNFKSFGMWHFGLSPFLLLGCFAFSLPKKWKWITLSVIFLMITINLSSRSMTIKAFFAAIIAIGYLLKKYYGQVIIKIAFWACYIIPIVLLYLGITGTFNIFSDTYKNNSGKYTQTVIDKDGFAKEEDALTDTRTFIYVEVLQSAINHRYIIAGRTPARGNDSAYFGDRSLTGYHERLQNELCHLSVFTWLGLIGVILYSLFYFRASFLAVYKSNSTAIKLLGCYVAFRWMYGWVEDAPSLQINNIALWIMIAMCTSKSFRKMNDSEFVKWLQNCLPHNNNRKRTTISTRFQSL